jgi:hypothetical protein
VAPEVAANRAGQNAVQLGVEAGLEEVEDLGVYTVQVRHNPARCSCPDFEFLLEGAWVRAWPSGAEPAMRRLQGLARQSQDAPGIQFVSVRGRLTEMTRRSDENVEFPVFEAVE